MRDPGGKLEVRYKLNDVPEMEISLPRMLYSETLHFARTVCVCVSYDFVSLCGISISYVFCVAA